MALTCSDILTQTPQGLYCPLGDFHLDPVRPVPRALVTHGHSDHARAGHGAVLATAETLDIMAVRYGDDFAGTTQAAGFGETDRARRRQRHLPPGRPRARLGPDRRRGGRLPDRRLGRLQAPPRPDLRRLRAGALRRLHHRGDLRPAGLPPPDPRAEIAQAARTRSPSSPSARISSASMRSARRSALIAPPPRGRLRRADLHPRRAAAALRLLRASGIDLGDMPGAVARATSARKLRRRDRARPALRLRRTLGRAASPIRSPPSPPAGCGCAPAPASAASSCRSSSPTIATGPSSAATIAEIGPARSG